MFGLTPTIRLPLRPTTTALLLGALFFFPARAVAAVADVPLAGDLDGDGKADLVMWQAATGTFRWLLSSAGYSDAAARSKQWGAVNDVPLIGDLDGDGKGDLVVWRPGTATFYWLTSSSGYNNATAGSRQWGASDQPDVPLLGDLDGDGKSELIVWRRATGTFYWLTSSTGYSYGAQGARQWGAVVNGVPDVPRIQDLDGDRRADLIVWRPGIATYYWLTSSSGYGYGAQGSKQWGDQADVPLLADLDADGKAELMVWRQGNGMFYWLTSLSGYSYGAQGSKQWGGVVAGVPDVPLTGDMDGDNKADLIFARRATGEFRWLTSSSGYSASFGVTGASADGPATNQSPVVSAGSSQSITLPASASLNGTATDDGLPVGSSLTRTWSKFSGPGTVGFGNVTSQSTTATFSAAGAYILRLTASDGALSTYADVAVNVSGGSSCSGVTVSPGTTNLQSVVNAQPEGTTFCFQPGTYRLSGPVMAKSRDRFIGQPGAILDGQGSVARGIWGNGGSSGQRDVVVQGLTIANFTGAGIQMGWYWTVTQNDLHHNQIGVVVGTSSTVDGNYIHDNRQYGINGGPANNIVIVNNEVARNNTSYCDGACAGDAGGSKIVGSTAGTTGLVWRNNNVHDNRGPGIWSDGNVRALYEGNTVSNNSATGLQHELSWDAIIRNNTFSNNDSENIGRSCWWGANLLVQTSMNVEVYGNTITGSNGSNGLCVVSSDRSDVAPFPTVTANFYGHDNVVYMSGAATSGFVKDIANQEQTAATNNRFVHNTYRVPNVNGAWWSWPTVTTATWSTWRGSAGQDTTGTVAVW